MGGCRQDTKERYHGNDKLFKYRMEKKNIWE